MDTKEEITNIFIEEPEKEFYVREISRILKKSPTTISKYLKKLKEENFLQSEKKLGHLIFQASDNPNFKNKKREYHINQINKSGLIDFLVEKLEPEAIILFGSFAKAENSKHSDIDLLVISPIKKEIKLTQFENKLKHEIQLFVHSKKEIQDLKKKNKELLNNYINGIKLYGFIGLFK